MPGTEVGTAKPKYGSVRKLDVLQRAVERAGDQRARRLDRHAPADAIDAAGPAAVDQPAIDFVLGNVFAQQAPYSAGGRGRNGAPKQVENSGSTPTRPFSVPATLAV